MLTRVRALKRLNNLPFTLNTLFHFTLAVFLKLNALHLFYVQFHRRLPPKNRQHKNKKTMEKNEEEENRLQLNILLAHRN